MATWKFKNLDKYVAQLEELSAHAEGQLKAAVWEGAKVVADNMKAAMNGIPTDDEYHKPGEMRAGPRSEEKAGMIAGFGLSRMRTGGSVTTKAGFSGSTNGVSNATLARQIESGTSWMRKYPAIRRAANASRGAAEAAMAAKLEQMISQYNK